eukprot:287984-Amphidinium_carterae.1
MMSQSDIALLPAVTCLSMFLCMKCIDGTEAVQVELFALRSDMHDSLKSMEYPERFPTRSGGMQAHDAPAGARGCPKVPMKRSNIRRKTVPLVFSARPTQEDFQNLRTPYRPPDFRKVSKNALNLRRNVKMYFSETFGNLGVCSKQSGVRNSKYQCN